MSITFIAVPTTIQSFATTWSNSVLVIDDLTIAVTDHWTSQRFIVYYLPIMPCECRQCDVIVQVIYTNNTINSNKAKQQCKLFQTWPTAVKEF